jgi:hypothetical protein
MKSGLKSGLKSGMKSGTKPLVYFNKNFSVTTAQLEALRNGGRFRTLASHTDPQHPMMLTADDAVLEQKYLGGKAYLQVLLEICERHGVAVFLVGKEREFLADHIADFAAVGTQLVVPASRVTQDLLEAKDEFLRGVPNILPIPAWCTFNDLASFKTGVEQLKSDPAFVPGKTRLCVKPAKGIYASGFRVLLEKPNLRSFLSGLRRGRTNLRQPQTTEDAVDAHARGCRTFRGLRRLAGRTGKLRRASQRRRGSTNRGPARSARGCPSPDQALPPERHFQLSNQGPQEATQPARDQRSGLRRFALLDGGWREFSRDCGASGVG